MKTVNKDIKSQIIAHLKTVDDATADQIAKALKACQESVNSALNALRTEAVIEAKVIKGRGKANWYWLACPADHRIDDEPMPEPDAALLASANRMLSNRVKTLLEAIGSTDDSDFGVATACFTARANRKDVKRIPELERTISSLRNEMDALDKIIAALEAKAAIPDAPKPVQKKAQTPRKPFTVTGLNGYHAGGEKVTLFLDRRLNARSVTLTAEKLNQLANMARVA